ncbi:MAG TPA: serine/threonine-protein kinase [Vicinamibacterales bacterium]|nr:serine/threonine-protein kinase [Vicinamibacterales bacterium]
MRPISPDRWRVLSPYLDQALEIAPDERPGWLASISAQDAGLAADLQRILAEQEVVQESRFLELTVLDPRVALTHSLEGQVVGAYRLVSPIGQGGSGSVWLGERCDGRFQGNAAIKLLNVALLGRAGEERFKREGTILARLKHPRIAHLIDAGVSPSGQPYLVLEHVDGQSIDRYCDERALGVEARIGLFLDVLEAVAHAHANLIVHRDIKPANVLVSTDGQVKLLDFGIAKLIERNPEWDGAGGDGAGALTREGGTALTPQYAAPEQLAGGTVTTATDVYALGVLLYLLLTGQHPAGRAIGSPATLVRAIVDTEPQRVSDVVVCATETEEALAQHATERGTTSSRLRRALRGDLDTIVAKTLKKNPSDRYSSVTALADDLRRYLRHEPISARPDTLRYRTASFVRRHRGGVLTSAAVVLLVSGLIAVYTVRLATERDRARREAEKAVKVSDMLMELLTSADPYTIRGARGEPTVRGLLDAGAAQVQNALAAQPDLQAQMLTTMGRTYRRLGIFDKAQALLEQALASGQKAFGVEDVRVAQTLDYLGVVLADQGDLAGAGQRLEQALAMRRRLLGPEHEDVAVTLAELGRIYQDQGLNGRAEPLHREALAIRRKALGDGHRETAVSLSDLASVLRLNGDLAGAEMLLTQCLEINRKTRGEDHPNTHTTLHDLALIAAARGDYRSAESQLRHVLSNQRKTLGDSHPVLATTLNSLSRVLVEQRRYDEAASALQEALDIARGAWRADHQLLAIYTINLASVELTRGEPQAAEALLREGLRIRANAPGVVPSRRRTFLDDDWSIGATKSLLGASLAALGRYEEAEAMLLEARRDLEALPAPRDSEMKTTITRLIELYTAWGKHQAAAAYRALLAS